MRALYYLTFTAIIALVSVPSSSPFELISNEPHQVVDEDYENYLATAGNHPWCGTFDLGGAQVGWLQPKVGGKEVQENKGHRQ